MSTFQKKKLQYPWQHDNSYASQPNNTAGQIAQDSLNMRADTIDMIAPESHQNTFEQHLQTLVSKTSQYEAQIAQLTNDLEEAKSTLFTTTVDKDGLFRRLQEEVDKQNTQSLQA